MYTFKTHNPKEKEKLMYSYSSRECSCRSLSGLKDFPGKDLELLHICLHRIGQKCTSSSLKPSIQLHKIAQHIAPNCTVHYVARADIIFFLRKKGNK